MADMLGRHGTRQADRQVWLRDAAEADPAQELIELDLWYDYIDEVADPYYELPTGFDGAWSTSTPE